MTSLPDDEGEYEEPDVLAAEEDAMDVGDDAQAPANKGGAKRKRRGQL